VWEVAVEGRDRHRMRIGSLMNIYLGNRPLIIMNSCIYGQKRKAL
jgi:hypothetical protein